MKTILIACLALLTAAADRASAGDLSAELSCPASKRAGGPLGVTVRLENDCDYDIPLPVDFRGTYVSMLGNPQREAPGEATVGGVAVFGPFQRAPFSGRVPAGVWSPEFQCTPGASEFRINIVPQLPASLVGTVATVLVGVEELDGEGGATDECLVSIAPAQ